MFRLRDLSIRRRLTVVGTVASSTALLSAGGAFLAYDVMTFREAKARRLGTSAEILAYNAASALEFQDDVAGARTLRALAAEPHVMTAALYSRDGRVFARYRRQDATEEAPEAAPGPLEASGHRYAGGRLRVFRPVLLEGTAIGSVLIVADLQDLAQRVRDYAAMVALVAVAAFVVAWLASARLQAAISTPILRLAELARVVSRDKDYSVRAGEGGGGEVGVLVATFNEMLGEIQERDRELTGARRDLEQRVEQRTADLKLAQALLERRAQELEAANSELESFSYSVSHDLRAPLRSIDGFSQALLEDYSSVLDEDGRRHLERVRRATQTMAVLIDDLLKLARVARAEMRRDEVDLSALASEVVAGLRDGQPAREVEFLAKPGLASRGDSRLLRVVLENLLGNAWKFTSKQPRARIEFGDVRAGNGPAYFVRDDGAGFDMNYATKLFGAFQRLHSVTEFPGTGIGLATCARIIHRHGGSIWAESVPGQGATFFFTLGGGEP
jgi:signal transduction histidine kinase